MCAAAADLGRLRCALDLPECECPSEWVPCRCTDCRGKKRRRRKHHDHLRPCAHVLRARPHGLALKEWTQFLEAHFPGEHRDPSPPFAPANVLRRRHRVSVYARRASAGVGLYHEGDAWRQSGPLILAVGARAHKRLRNGYADPDEELWSEGRDEAPGPAPWPYQQQAPPAPERPETAYQRRCRERDNRVNACLTQLRGAGRIDYATVPGYEAPAGERKIT